MGRIKLKIWILLLGWLWLQPALALHQFESALPTHDSHHCLVCVLHLDSKQAIPPTSGQLHAATAGVVNPLCIARSADPAPRYTYAIRAPPPQPLTSPFYAIY